MITLYTYHCPACEYLKSLLDEKKIEYTEVNDLDALTAKGITSVPKLEVDGIMMDNAEAVNYVNSYTPSSAKKECKCETSAGEKHEEKAKEHIDGGKYEKYSSYLDFINEYAASSNAATGSQVDSNANVEHKNVTTASGELYKRDAIGINRLRMYRKMTEMYGKDTAELYLKMLDGHDIYRHDETNPLLPYTYAATEVVNVRYNAHTYSVPFSRLWELCHDDPELLDEEKVVLAKYPKDMYVEDKDGFTKVERLIKKLRHRDLCHVETENGNIIVTDNHPMIVEDDIDKTVPASDVAGKSQYRTTTAYNGKTRVVDMKSILSEHFFNMEIDNHIVYIKEKETVAEEIIMDREVGFLIGCFIGCGSYGYNPKVNQRYVNFKTRDAATINELMDTLRDSFKVQAYRAEDSDGIVNEVVVPSTAMDIFLYHYCNIHPIYDVGLHLGFMENILEYEPTFIDGVIEGLIKTLGCSAFNQRHVIFADRSTALQFSNALNAVCYPNHVRSLPAVVKEDDAEHWFVVDFEYDITPLFEIEEWAKQKEKCQFEQWVKVMSSKTVDNEKYLEQNEYIYDITTESHTFVCNNLWVHNCVSITMYPFLTKGLAAIGGGSTAPNNLDSFCGSFINLCFAIASQFAGAVSTPEFLPYMDYFVRKEYGDDYYLHADDVVDLSARKRTIRKVLHDKYEQITYSLNQPAAARSFQSIFWNIAYFDHPYFDGMFDNFVFPDGSKMKWESVSWLQKDFMKWFNHERTRNVLTFPVETLNLLDDGKDYVDKEWADYAAEMLSEGHSFFLYRSGSVDSLASCCRLRNELQDNTFSYTLGAGGVSTGSKGVITINMNRLIQNVARENPDDTLEQLTPKIQERVKFFVENIHKFLIAWNEILKDEFASKLLPVYDAGFISLSKQFLTIGM